MFLQVLTTMRLIVKVIRKEYRAEDKVPILMDRIMHIIRRCIDDELKQL